MSSGFAPPPGAPTIETSVLIAAPIADVWAILTAFGSYGEWNTQLPRIDGVAAAGSTIVLSPAGEPPKSVRVEVLTPYRMRWIGGADDPADFQGDHFFELETVAVNETLFLHREFFTGRLAASVLETFREAIRSTFDAFNACLRAAAEQATDGGNRRLGDTGLAC